MATVAALQRDLELAKEGLKSVDENIKKLTGRDPSEFRPAAGRRVMLKRDYPDRNTGQGPAAKRLDSSGTPGRLWSRVVSTRTSQDRNRPSSRLDSEGEEEEEDGDKPAIQSSVVATPAPSRLKRDVITKTDDKTKSRNRRMFGVLLQGTLQKFKDKNSQKTEKDKRREEINKKLEEAEQKEKEELSSQRRELFTERRAKQAELKILQRKVDMAELQEEWDKHGEKLSHFIMTKANPPIFYMPAKHNDKTQKLLEESTRSVKRAMAKRRAEIEEEQELEEERIKNARLSVSNEGDSVSKGRGEGGDILTEGDVEMREERPRVFGEEEEEETGKWSQGVNPENGVGEERRAREEQQNDRVEMKDEDDEEGEVD
ncbi:pinin-like [Montipora capricornis]|uniref:pinin-like n=1 Tax=Montipora capricornis TaxID=246305 RepID=UPI0035F1EA91